MGAEKKDQNRSLNKTDYIWGGLGAAATAPFGVTAIFESIKASETKAETQVAEPAGPQLPENNSSGLALMGFFATVIALIALLTVAKEGTRNQDNALVGFSAGFLAAGLSALSIFSISQFDRGETESEANIQKNQTELYMPQKPGADRSHSSSNVFYLKP